MKTMLRLDKFLSDMGIGSRNEVKKYLKSGRVSVNNKVIKAPECKVNVNDDEIVFDGRRITYQLYEYFMLNKPAGVVSATTDNVHDTVIESITSSVKKDLFPVGRLDIDTEGLLIITNDGDLAHKLLSPKKHVPKTYYAKIEGRVCSEDVEVFKKGIKLEDDFTTLPAELKIITSDAVSEIEVTIYEGKFHQVKRMFQSVGKKVVYLKRLSVGPLVLDPDLAVGGYRPLSDDEVNLLRQ